MRSTSFPLILTLVFGLLLADQAQAQRFVVKANPGQLLVGRFPLGVEVTVSKRFAVDVMAELMAGRWKHKAEGTLWTLTGLGGEGELRYFAKTFDVYDLAPRGFFIGLWGSYAYAAMNAEQSPNVASGKLDGQGTTQTFLFGGGGMFGYQLIAGNFIAFDLHLGMGYYYSSSPLDVQVRFSDNSTEVYPFQDAGVDGLLPRIGLGVGIAIGKTKSY